MNSFGNKFRITIFGESHGEMIGVVLDGIPCGIELSENDFSNDLLRRKSGALGTTSRTEEDTPKIVSGLYNGYTTGAPLTIIFDNSDCRSDDYSPIINTPRPSHADYVAAVKYKGFNDPRGGGHFSGRLTLPLVAAGVVAKRIVEDVNFNANLIEIGGEQFPNNDIINKAISYGDSVGGIIECRCDGVPVGCGEPFFDSFESLLSHLIFSIPGVRGIEFGDGFRSARMFGSEHNDCYIDGNGRTAKNGAGGVNGGITNGNQIVFRVAIKPTSTIASSQDTFNKKSGNVEPTTYKGRHDVCFALRVPVVIEACAAIVLCNFIDF